MMLTSSRPQGRRLQAASVIALISAMGLSAPAWAQSQGDTSAGAAPAAVQPTPSDTLPVETAHASAEPFQRFDALAMKGWERPLPKSGDTLIGDKWGIRDTLADVGIGFLGYASGAFQYNAAQNNGSYKGAQLYNGQKFTRSVSNAAVFATYDLGKIGVDNGQIIFSALYTSDSLNKVDGPNSTRIGRLAYFQSLFNDRVEFKVGYFDNGFEFLGTQTAGSLAGGTLGPQAGVPNEVGLSYSGYSTPSADLRINMDHHFYTKVAVQRSLPPGGATPENAANPSGLQPTVAGTRLLTIDEWGWDRPAKVDALGAWIRAGGIYNTTHFTKFSGGVSDDNWAAYVAVDRQLFHIDPSKPGRGLYLGGTFDYAPPAQNFVSQYYEGRIYGIGLLNGRPSDLASIIATANIYSQQGLTARTTQGNMADQGTFSVIGSYAYQLMPGLYIQPGFGAVLHPVYSPHLPTAYNAYLTLSFFL